MQDPKVKRLLAVGVILVFICIICILVTKRYIDKYNSRHAEANMLELKLGNLEQDLKNLDFRIKELEARRYALSLEKEQITKDYSSVKGHYVTLGKTIKVLERDVNTLKNAIKGNEEIEAASDDASSGDAVEDEEGGLDDRLSELQSQNDKLMKELAKKTTEKMIMEIALEAQAKRLGLSERYDPDLKEIIKDFVTSLQ